MNIYDAIYELLQKKESFCLATVLLKTGSAPRGEGAKMIIRKDYSIIDTIGGGLTEALTIKLCKDLFANKSSVIKYFNLSNKEASSLGLVCGGEQKVLVEYINAEDPEIVELFTKVRELKDKCQDFVLVTRIEKEEGKEYYQYNKWICTETAFYGEENNDVQKVFKNIRENYKQLQMNIEETEENNYLVEPVQNFETVYIFGAGHVSQKLAQITEMIGMRTVVLDDRSDFANRERFRDADDIIVTESFDNICRYVNIDRHSYVIIVTRGHAYDKEVLAQALETDAKYIGMIGSRSKRQFVYGRLLEEGFTQKDIDRVHSPIGIDIYAETPEEIAVSIGAEIIRVKRGPENEK